MRIETTRNFPSASSTAAWLNVCGHARRAVAAVIMKLSVAVILASALFFAGPLRAADMGTYTFDIPSQPLATALKVFADQAGLQLIFTQEDVAALETAGVTGSLSPRDALIILLKGTSLEFEFTDSDVLVVRRPSPHTASGQATSFPGQPDGSAASGESWDALATDSGARAGEATNHIEPSQVDRAQVRRMREDPFGPGGSDSLEEVVVTGSHLRGARVIGAGVQSASRQDIAASGRVTVADFVRTLPQNVSLGATEENQYGSQNASANFGAGSGINLRGLGTDATLVLINGRRMAPSGYGSFVDVSNIPLGAVERIDILADGASALYGSDAVAGVVNVILRRDFEGAEASARYGAGEGLDQFVADLSAGQSWATGNITLNYEYFRRSSLAAAERPFYTADLRAYGGPDLRSIYSNPGTLRVGGVTYALPYGQDGTALSASQVVAGTNNLFDPSREADSLPYQERHSVAASMSQTIGSSARARLDVLYSKRQFRWNTPPQQRSLSVPSSNAFYFNPTGGTQNVSVLYSFGADNGPWRTFGDVVDYSASGSIDLDLGAWNLEGYAVTAGDEATRQFAGIVNRFYLNEALADSNPATAFNPFGDGSHTAPETLHRIAGWQSETGPYRQDSGGINLQGPVLSLPGGDVRLAIGGELRHEEFKYSTIRYVSTAQSQAAVYSDSSRKVGALYAELLVPLVGVSQGLRGMHSLDLSIAARYENYSDFGSSTNPRIGLTWSPVAGFVARTSFGKSFKAPSLYNLSGRSFLYSATLPNPAAPAGVSPVVVMEGASRTLQPERATTWTAGIEYSPEAMSGLKLGATWFSIAYEDRIRGFAASDYGIALSDPAYATLITVHPDQALLDSLYANPLFSGAPLPAAEVYAVVDAGLRNTGVVDQSGIDLSGSYGFDLGGGRATISAAWTEILNYEVGIAPGAPKADTLDVMGNPISTRVRGGIGWQNEMFDASLFVNYVGGYANPQVSPASEVDNWTTVDSHVGVTMDAGGGWLEGLSLSIDAQNLLDATPPRVANIVAQTGYDPEGASSLGRMVTVTLSKRW